MALHRGNITLETRGSSLSFQRPDLNRNLFDLLQELAEQLLLVRSNFELLALPTLKILRGYKLVDVGSDSFELERQIANSFGKMLVRLQEPRRNSTYSAQSVSATAQIQSSHEGVKSIQALLIDRE
ncbi:hypothetical protein IE00_16550 [Paracoccus sp. SM22M-07]|nr:hypothetical protein IE00_16550 [Paracoccus sp. SM22M-07]